MKKFEREFDARTLLPIKTENQNQHSKPEPESHNTRTVKIPANKPKPIETLGLAVAIYFENNLAAPTPVEFTLRNLGAFTVTIDYPRLNMNDLTNDPADDNVYKFTVAHGNKALLLITPKNEQDIIPDQYFLFTIGHDIDDDLEVFYDPGMCL